MTTILPFEADRFLELHLRVEEEDWADRYTSLEVWRSTSGEGGPYEELSSNQWKPASIPSPLIMGGIVSGPKVNLQGKPLRVTINEIHDREITFVGPDPITYLSASYEIEAQAGDLLHASVDNLGRLALWTKNSGGLSSIRIDDGDAAPLLGLTVGDKVFGHDPRVLLQSGVLSYIFYDYYGRDSYFYRTRFSNRFTNVVSEFSPPFPGKARLGVDPSKVITGFVKLASLDGRPVANQEVLLFNSFTSQVVDGFTFTGGPKKLLTDDHGYAEFEFVRGLVVDVSIVGTSLIRRVTVPSDPSVLRFDLLDPAYGKDDSFAVQKADLPYAIREVL